MSISTTVVFTDDTAFSDALAFAAAFAVEVAKPTETPLSCRQQPSSFCYLVPQTFPMRNACPTISLAEDITCANHISQLSLPKNSLMSTTNLRQPTLFPAPAFLAGEILLQPHFNPPANLSELTPCKLRRWRQGGGDREVEFTRDMEVKTGSLGARDHRRRPTTPADASSELLAGEEGGGREIAGEGGGGPEL